MPPIPLSRATLAQYRSPVVVPEFDPAAVTAGIVHLGLGGFHRAHMARYTHRLMEQRLDASGWGIVGVERGLPCRVCGEPTAGIKADVHGCAC